MAKSEMLDDSDWGRVLAEAAKLFTLHNPYGVFGFRLGHRRRKGKQTRERALNVYVARKSIEPQHPIPPVAIRKNRKRIEVVPDVIGIGRRPTRSAGFIAPEFSGIHPGAAIRAQGSVRQYGGVACVLGAGGAPSHLLTAGHLFAPGEVGMSVVAAATPTSEQLTIGTLAVNLLDRPFEWMEFAMDAAAIELNPQGIDMAQSGESNHPGPRITGFVPLDGVGGRPVVEFLPTSGDYSSTAKTLDDLVDAQLQDEARGSYFVRKVIGTNHLLEDTFGDSGTILCSAIQHEAAVGVCLGQLGSMSLFEPVGRALVTLRQALSDPGLGIWS